MKCPKCGKSVEKDHSFCPKCGVQLIRRKSVFDVFFPRFEREFGQMEKQMEGTDKMLERRFETFDITPLFKQPVKGRGFTIKITRSGGNEPQISVKTFGGVKREDIEKQVKSQLKTGGPVRMTFRPKASRPLPQIPVRRPSDYDLPKPKTTEEPKTIANSLGNKVIVDMELPEVKSDNIRIKELQESVEVRAIAGDRGFFKIVTKPAKFRIVNKTFSKGKLHLEFG